MTAREFASWADPTTLRAGSSDRMLHNPFRGFGKDLVQVGRYWRWGRGSSRPSGLLRIPSQLEPRPPEVRQRLRDPFVGLLRRARVEVTGRSSETVPLVAVAHVESDADLAVLLEAIPRAWTVTDNPRKVKNRTALLVTDFAAPESAGVIAAASRLATRYGRPLVPIVVRRLVTGVQDETSVRLPTPKRLDEVLIRHADPITEGNPVAVARSASEAVGALLAEDDATWWQVLTGAVDSPLVTPMARWRRRWERTDPKRDAGRHRGRIWS